jgi:hypothetical protein
VTAGEPKLIGPVAGTTPQEQSRSRPKSRPIPADLLRAASRRLGIISLLGAGLWAFDLTGSLPSALEVLTNRTRSPAQTNRPHQHQCFPSASSTTANCSPNYVFDSEGNKHVKPECF